MSDIRIRSAARDRCVHPPRWRLLWAVGLTVGVVILHLAGGPGKRIRVERENWGGHPKIFLFFSFPQQLLILWGSIQIDKRPG